MSCIFKTQTQWLGQTQLSQMFGVGACLNRVSLSDFERTV